MSLTKGKFIIKFKGKQYDIQKFLRDHPGGTCILQSYRGRDIESAMAKFNHSSSAYHILEDFKIGEVSGDGKEEIDDVIYQELVDANLPGRVSKNGRIITHMEEFRNEEEIQYLEELEGRMDWSQPIFDQLHKIRDDYEAWSNSSVYRPLRLFHSPVMESLTFTPWWAVPLFWIPVILGFASSQYMKYVSCNDKCPSNPLSTQQFLYYVGVGIVLWTAIEYTLHRWVFHYDPGSSLNLIRIHFLIHGIHHKVPFDGWRQVFPPVPAVGIAVILYSPFHFILSYPVIVTVGVLIGYIAYDMVHYYIHHGSPKDGSYLYAMKRYHTNHHFVNHDKAFGISCKIWDYVFRTIVQIKKLGFSLHWS